MNKLFVCMLFALLSIESMADIQVKTKIMESQDVPKSIKNPVEIDSAGIANLKKDSESAIELLSKSAGYNIDYEDKSLDWVSKAIIGENEDLVEVVGPYFGEALISRLGGKWVLVEKEASVLLSTGELVFPYGKVYKNIKNGEEDSIFHFLKYLEKPKKK